MVALAQFAGLAISQMLYTIVWSPEDVFVATETAPVEILIVIPATGGETCDSFTVAVVARAPSNESFARTFATAVPPVEGDAQPNRWRR
jgi:hypothetical protein